MNIIKKFPIFALSGLLLIGSTQLSAQLPWQQLIAPSLLVLAAGATGFATHKALSDASAHIGIIAFGIGLCSPLLVDEVASTTGYSLRRSSPWHSRMSYFYNESFICNTLAAVGACIYHNSYK